MTSTSGASLLVLKTAPEGPLRRRVVAQGEWLASYDDPGIVRVMNVYDDGYSMPFLHTPSWPLTSPEICTMSVLDILERVWQQLPRARTQMNVFRSYVDRLNQPLLNDWLNEFADSDFEAACDVHGDPTLENLLFSADGTPVLVDPLPDAVLDGKTPSIAALDLGKVLQSALGYELVKRGIQASWSWDKSIAGQVRKACASDKEYDLARFFAAFHVARFIPYQTEYLAGQWRCWFPEIVDFLRRPQ